MSLLHVHLSLLSCVLLCRYGPKFEEESTALNNQIALHHWCSIRSSLSLQRKESRSCTLTSNLTKINILIMCSSLDSGMEIVAIGIGENVIKKDLDTIALGKFWFYHLNIIRIDDTNELDQATADLSRIISRGGTFFR